MNQGVQNYKYGVYFNTLPFLEIKHLYSKSKYHTKNNSKSGNHGSHGSDKLVSESKVTSQKTSDSHMRVFQHIHLFTVLRHN